MPRIKLTPGRISEFDRPKDKAQAFLWDTDVPGLAVRATAGAKAYIFQGRLNESNIRITIGNTRSWTIEDARAEARKLQTLIDQGTDPRQEKADRIAASEARRAEERQSHAPAIEAWETYLAARTGRWSPRTLAEHQKMADPGGKLRTKGRRPGESAQTQPGMLHNILKRPLKEIDAQLVRDMMRESAETRPVYARNAFNYLRGFLSWCADQPEHKDRVHIDACAGRIARDELPKKAARDDCLQREMLKPWFEQVRAISNPTISAYLQCLLLTGARREELAGLKWEDVNFRWQSLSIHDKVEGERVIPLTPHVASLLRDLERRNNTPPPAFRILHGKRIANDLAAWTPSPWVFGSKTSADGRLQDPRKAHNKAVLAAGLPPMSLHGLRRSFGTLCEWVECPVGVSAQIMGHKPSATAEKHYRRRPLDLLRMWHTKIEGWILEQAGVEQLNQIAATPGLRAVTN